MGTNLLVFVLTAEVQILAGDIPFSAAAIVAVSVNDGFNWGTF